MNKKKYYFLAIMLGVIVICSSLVQVFAVQGKFTGDEVYSSLKDKYEWEYRSETILEDYLTKGLYFENHKGDKGYDMSLIIPHTDSFGGVIEGFTAMLDSEGEAIKLFLDLIDTKENFSSNYGGRRVDILYNDEDTRVIMHSIKEKLVDNLEQ